MMFLILSVGCSRVSLLMLSGARHLVPTTLVLGPGAKTPRDLVGSDKLVQKVLDIAADLNCVYFIENPHSGLLKTRAVVAGCPMELLDYCKYDALYRQRTAIWTDSGRAPVRALCKYDCPVSSGRRHNSRAQRASDGERRSSLEELYSIPEPLCKEIA